MTEGTVLLVVSAVLEPLRTARPLLGADVFGLAINLAIFAAVSWFLWNGYNWARWVTFLICAMCLLEIGSLNEAQTASKLLSTIYDAGLAIFLLWFLNQQHVRRWFRWTAKSTSVPPPPRDQAGI